MIDAQVEQAPAPPPVQGEHPFGGSKSLFSSFMRPQKHVFAVQEPAQTGPGSLGTRLERLGTASLEDGDVQFNESQCISMRFNEFHSILRVIGRSAYSHSSFRSAERQRKRRTSTDSAALSGSPNACSRLLKPATEVTRERRRRRRGGAMTSSRWDWFRAPARSCKGLVGACLDLRSAWEQ